MFICKEISAVASLAASLLSLSACAGSELSTNEVALQNFPVRIEGVLEDMREWTMYDTDCWIALEESSAFYAGPPQNSWWEGNAIGFGVCGPFPGGENDADEWMVADLSLGPHQNDFGGYDYKVFMSFVAREEVPPAFGEIYSIFGDSAYPNKEV